MSEADLNAFIAQLERTFRASLGQSTFHRVDELVQGLAYGEFSQWSEAVRDPALTAGHLSEGNQTTALKLQSELAAMHDELLFTHSADEVTSGCHDLLDGLSRMTGIWWRPTDDEQLATCLELLKETVHVIKQRRGGPSLKVDDKWNWEAWQLAYARLVHDEDEAVMLSPTVTRLMSSIAVNFDVLDDLSDSGVDPRDLFFDYWHTIRQRGWQRRAVEDEIFDHAIAELLGMTVESYRA